MPEPIPKSTLHLLLTIKMIAAEFPVFGLHILLENVFLHHFLINYKK